MLENIENIDDESLKDTILSLCLANEHVLEEGVDMNLTAREKKSFHKWAAKIGVAEELKQEGWQEGRQEGRQEGWREGIEEERRKNAKAMKYEGIDINTIAKITGLADDDIKQM
ncbi:MAG: hypothetical protein LBU70_10075 [Chitinispirillales bacterium]|jgi:predicted transposase/invertase (TIGR01784 family)|nr:hypothetical protein [Chitinispirillales bacterium]